MAHSSSFAFINFSIITLLSYLNAVFMCLFSSLILYAMLIPSDEPHEEGLMITGNSRFIFFIFLYLYSVIYGSWGILW